MSTDLIIGMAGAGGDGIVAAGEALIAAAAADGYSGLMTKSFGSQIRGGESSCRVRLSTRPVLNPGGALHLAVALNWDDFLKFGAELPVGGGTVSYTSTRAVPNASRQAVRVTVDVDNGSSGSTATFYTADSISGEWTQLGEPATESGTTSIGCSPPASARKR